MAMARALAVQDRPRRSVVVAFWPAEEAGQLDSSHYVRHPLWPLEGTVAYVNLDMIAHPWSRAEIEQLVAAKNPPGAALFLAQATPGNFAEVGIAESAPWLGDALARAARGTRMTLHLDRTDGKNGGSDYRAFAHRDVPFIRFFGNFFPGYHEPGDTLENLDPGQVERMARLAFATAWLIADAPPGALN
jgi:Zn-dependent M28 family amino/carboxypeptidase